ncbi:ABC transporter ATP-binding protein [Pseudactinotalea sp. Z1748]|uniref:ABC transporter ATP-binding protein n=1 Tax=Pseudactinotalea sp. Z1748 TaxID=3413027 RepID=UPI003C7D8F07
MTTVQNARPHEADAGATPMMESRDVRVVFRTGIGAARNEVVACDDVNLQLNRGEIVSLVGESGSGKSTLARAMNLLQQVDSGEIRLDGQPVVTRGRGKVKPLQYYKDVQMIFQDPFGSLNGLKPVSHIIGRALKLHGLAGTRAEVRERTLEVLERVHLSPAKEYIDRYPTALSGGQMQRIAIARALAVEPKVILADEPTSMLDVSIRLGVLNLLSELRDKQGVSILYITHDIASARYLADRMAVMYKGRLVEVGATEQVISEPRHEYTRTLIGAAPDPSRRKKKRRT